jgi:hypothetical protein
MGKKLSASGLLGKSATFVACATRRDGSTGISIELSGVITYATETKNCRGDACVTVLVDVEGKGWLCDLSELKIR